MRQFAMFVILLITIQAQAGDKKLGNLIAVERPVENIVDRCTQKLQDTGKKTASFYCTLNLSNSPTETLITKGGLIRYRTQSCRVDADLGNNNLMIAFGTTKNESSLDEALLCLKNAVQSNDNLSVIFYTLE